MSAPCDTESAPEMHKEEKEIVLRLGEILPRVPAHLLKPGPHDASLPVRFSVEELAEKIAHGRVSVPLDRLASVCPEVFRESSAFVGEQEVQLPLQKLLAQVSPAESKESKAPAANGAPKEQEGRAAAGDAGAPTTQTVAPAPPVPSPGAGIAVAAEAPAAAKPAGIAKAISSARNLFGLFGRPTSSSSQVIGKKADTEKKTSSEEKQSASAASEKSTKPAPAQLALTQPEAKATGPVAQPVPGGFISLRVLPIFRLLPDNVLRPGAFPSGDVRITLPLSTIDPQLAGGHVEIPVGDFIKTLPEELRGALNPVPEAQVWIPLDEIFQSLPEDHLFYMPPLEPLPELEAVPIHEALKNIAEEERDTKDIKDAEGQKPVTETAPSGEATTAPAGEPSPEPAGENMAPAPAAEPATEAETTPTTPEAPPATASAAAPAAPASEPAPPASRAPWMRGFQVPPPRLFSGGTATAEPEPLPADPAPAPAPTPEAKRTVDFLANQPGVFAAAAFVQGAVFASEDFPRRPDLDALRDFMGVFIEQARESGRRLGWKDGLTIGCEQFQVTAVVRESHFIVALHYDRVLPTPAHDALIAAADELSRAGV